MATTVKQKFHLRQTKIREQQQELQTTERKRLKMLKDKEKGLMQFKIMDCGKVSSNTAGNAEVNSK